MAASESKSALVNGRRIGASGYADDSGFIVSESLTRPSNFHHGVCALTVLKVKIARRLNVLGRSPICCTATKIWL